MELTSEKLGSRFVGVSGFCIELFLSKERLLISFLSSSSSSINFRLSLISIFDSSTGAAFENLEPALEWNALLRLEIAVNPSF